MNRLTAYTGVHTLSPSFEDFARNVTILVQEGKIKQIAKTEGPDLPSDADVVQLDGQYVIPGLVDMHVHVDEAMIPNQLEMFLRYGVTTVRDVGSHVDRTASLAAEARYGRKPGPTIFSLGELVDGPEPFWPDISVVPEDAGQLCSHVERIAKLGLPGVKFYFNLSAELLAAGVGAANEHWLLTVAHVGGAVTALEAVSHGVGSIEHITALTWDLVPTDRWPEKGSFLDLHRVWRDVVDTGSNQAARVIERFKTHHSYARSDPRCDGGDCARE